MPDIPDYIAKYDLEPEYGYAADGTDISSDECLLDLAAQDINKMIHVAVEGEVAERLAACAQGRVVAVGDMLPKDCGRVRYQGGPEALRFRDSSDLRGYYGPGVILECSKLDLQGKKLPLNRKVWLVVQPKDQGDVTHAARSDHAAAPGRAVEGACQPRKLCDHRVPGDEGSGGLQGGPDQAGTRPDSGVEAAPASLPTQAD